MDKEAQRIAIAEACGWERVELGWNRWKHKDDNVAYGIERLPDYFSDLNAMHEAEKVIWPTNFRFQENPKYKLRAWFGTPDKNLPQSLDKDLLRAEEAKNAEDNDNLRKFRQWKKYDSLVHAIATPAIRATADQRAEAFLRTIGRWTEPVSSGENAPRDREKTESLECQSKTAQP